jgi:hypothetical protein
MNAWRQLTEKAPVDVKVGQRKNGKKD